MLDQKSHSLIATALGETQIKAVQQTNKENIGGDPLIMDSEISNKQISEPKNKLEKSEKNRKSLAEKIKKPYLNNVLVRVQHSNPDKVTKAERIEAAELDYEISSNISRDSTLIKDKYMILIDDILTSKSTTKAYYKLKALQQNLTKKGYN